MQPTVTHKFKSPMPEILRGSLWMVIENPMDHVEKVTLSYTTGSAPVKYRELAPDELVLISHSYRNPRYKEDRRYFVITSSDAGWIHVDWWRTTDGQPPMLIKIADPP